MTDLGIHPQRLDLYVHAGDPIAFAVPLINGLGEAQPLTGWTADARAYQYVGGPVLHNFTPTIADDRITVVARPEQTAAWTWPVYAARLVITATPPDEGPVPVLLGWLRFYPI